jgi:hypothetical protein
MEGHVGCDAEKSGWFSVVSCSLLQVAFIETSHGKILVVLRDVSRARGRVYRTHASQHFSDLLGGIRVICKIVLDAVLGSIDVAYESAKLTISSGDIASWQ